MKVVAPLQLFLRKWYGRYGHLMNHYEVFLSQMLHAVLGYYHIQWHPQLIRHITNLWTYYRNGPSYRSQPYYQISGGFQRTLRPAELANIWRLLLRIPGSVPFGTCICSNIETIFSWACYVFGFWISNIPRYFYFASVFVPTFDLLIFFIIKRLRRRQ